MRVRSAAVSRGHQAEVTWSLQRSSEARVSVFQSPRGPEYILWLEEFDSTTFTCRLQVTQNNFVREIDQEVKSPQKKKSTESLVNKVKKSVSKAYSPDHIAEKKVNERLSMIN